MPPLFACFPVFFLFLSIAVIAAVMLVGASWKGKLGGTAESRAEARQLPWWFVVLAFLVPLVVLVLLSFVTAG